MKYFIFYYALALFFVICVEEFENARITVYSRACETLARVWRDLIINQCQKKTYFIEFTTDCSPMTIHRKVFTS